MPEITTLSSLLSPDALKLLSANGVEFVQDIGLETIRGLVLDVLSGKNPRSVTESLTRRRIAALNLAMVEFFLRGTNQIEDFLEKLPEMAVQRLKQKRLSQTERLLAYWLLGLTKKANQNILRDDPQELEVYRDQYVKACSEVIANHQLEHGQIGGVLQLDSGLKAEVNWLLLTYLLNAVGAETLTIRGSEKSAYGKLFEKLVLGSLLHLLGFRFVHPTELESLTHVYCLSTTAKRESDATLYYEPGKAVRFDIGFIGRGNSEISLDKVTRFERVIDLAGTRYYVSTIILVDKVGENSNLLELAKAVDGWIVQMSASYWPNTVAELLHEMLGYESDILRVDQAELGAFLAERIRDAPLASYIGLMP